MILYPDLHDPEKLRQIIADCGEDSYYITKRVGCSKHTARAAIHKYRKLIKQEKRT